jgi:3-deoxy-7-phosphoheptulonate synthase
MFVLLKEDISEAQLQEVVDSAEAAGAAEVCVTRAGSRPVLRVRGGSGQQQTRFERLPGVERVLPQEGPWVLVGRAVQSANTVVHVGRAAFGSTRVEIIGGPCAVESEDQLRGVAEKVAATGARVLRGGAFKPRTSPYAFQGLGERGLEILRSVADEFGLAVVTEVMAPEQAELVARYADMLQVGSRSVQNFPLLDAVARTGKPILLKRGMMSEIDELLASAEYILLRGNMQVVLCERGLRGFDRQTRNILDVVAVPLLKQLTHLPVIVDPSHATGRCELVVPAALAAVAAGADGLIVEVHAHPETALSDGRQALTPNEFSALSIKAAAVAAAVSRSA